MADAPGRFRAPVASPTGYRRWLDIDQAVAGVSYQDGDDVWTREIFSSAVDQAIVMRIACTGKGALVVAWRWIWPVERAGGERPPPPTGG